MIPILIIALVTISHVTDARITDEQVQKYEQAKKLYYENDYEKAIKDFESLLNEYPESGYLYYNLGNSYFKAGKFGYARLYYEKAKLLIPRDAELKINLTLLKTKLVDTAGRSFSDYLVGTFYFWSSSSTVSEYRLLVILFSLCFWAWCFQKYFRKKRVLSTSTIILLLIFTYIISGYYLKTDQESPGQYGVILQKQVDIKASYLEKDEPLFQLHHGTKVRIIDEQSFGEAKKWLKIALPEGQKGWVMAKDVGEI